MNAYYLIACGAHKAYYDDMSVHTACHVARVNLHAMHLYPYDMPCGEGKPPYSAHTFHEYVL